MKTNAVRVLDRLGIGYELREYEVDPADLAAETVARKIGLPARQVFKTLVMRGERRGVLLAVVPGDAEADLKALARERGDRSVARGRPARGRAAHRLRPRRRHGPRG